MREKYSVQLIINDQVFYEKDYKTYQAIADDFKIFGTSENVRTCARMQEKGMLPKYLKGYKYKYFKILKKPIKL